MGAFLRELGLETPLLRYRLVNSWPSVVGEFIAAHTRAADLREDCLFVETDSASLCTELQMRRSQLVEALNNGVKAKIINDIRFSPTLVK